MMDAGCENFVLWFSRTCEKAFLDAFSNNYATRVFVQQKGGGATVHPPGCMGPDNGGELDKTSNLLYHVRIAIACKLNPIIYWLWENNV